MLSLLSNMFTNLNLTDIETGYKAFRREVIQSIDIEKTGSASSRKSPPRSRAAGTAFTRWVSAISVISIWREKRSAGKTACGPSGAY